METIKVAIANDIQIVKTLTKVKWKGRKEKKNKNKVAPCLNIKFYSNKVAEIRELIFNLKT